MQKMKRGRKDHFTPQGYLRGFVHPERLNAQKPLWVLDVKRLEWREKSPAAFGWEKGLYDYAADSTPDGTAEEIFLRPENDFPVVREKIRSEGYPSWVQYRDQLVEFAAMLSARSPMFLDQAASSIRDSLAPYPDADVLAHNYGLTTMRTEVTDRGWRWRSLHWALRFTTDPASPAIGCDQSVGMDGHVEDVRFALDDPQTTLFFPLSWDMCLFGSPARLEPTCAQFLEADLRRLRSFVTQQACSFVVSPVRLESVAAPKKRGFRGRE